MSVVLDSSALLAWLRNEQGAEHVDFPGAVLSTVNWSEVAQKITQRGGEAAATLHRVSVLGVSVEPFTEADALSAAALWEVTKHLGLSLGDRACFALAQRLDLPILTTDRAWSDSGVDVNVHLIR